MVVQLEKGGGDLGIVPELMMGSVSLFVGLQAFLCVCVSKLVNFSFVTHQLGHDLQFEKTSYKTFVQVFFFIKK